MIFISHFWTRPLEEKNRNTLLVYSACTKMGFFRRSKREVIRDNAAQGKDAEKDVEFEYRMKGYKVKRTGKGHDYKATRRNWFTGKNEIVYLEVKSGDAKLSQLQKKKKRQLGRKYKVERRSPNLFGNVNDDILCTNKSTGRKRRTKTKSKKDDIFDGLLGGGSTTKSTGRKRRTKTKSKKDNFFGGW